MNSPAPPEPYAVMMRRASVEGLPRHSLRDGFRIRGYRTGDEAVWLAVQRSAERFLPITDDLFRKEFGIDEGRLQKCMLFLEDPEGRPIGTATAWHLPDRDAPDCGRVHWIAIAEGAQGAGLGKALMSAVCERLRAQGFRKLVLGTHVTRIPAINLYLAFGFLPEIRHADDLAEWRKLLPHLKDPVHLPASAPGATA
ncbi:MAG: GNAT family N-acetyltransferase [Verrucomicrobiae bacterium]|nr:GNAT family N-acetyltransferase [Verrucomicrobiae bacterium]